MPALQRLVQRRLPICVLRDRTRLPVEQQRHHVLRANRARPVKWRRAALPSSAVHVRFALQQERADIDLKVGTRVNGQRWGNRPLSAEEQGRNLLGVSLESCPPKPGTHPAVRDPEKCDNQLDVYGPAIEISLVHSLMRGLKFRTARA
eukprot:3072845-Rhodomonas_salina.2